MAGLFPKWMNALPTFGAVAGLGGLGAVVLGGWYYLTPDFFEVGYMPQQPGPVGFSHQIHAGRLGMDCRYCHTNVEKSPDANVPDVATCMACHAENKLAGWDTHRVEFVREAYAADASIPWRNVHVLPDYVHFPHHVHVNAGVSCYSCHGSIPGMPEVYQAESLAMGWCLDCHRNPQQHLVPPELVTDLMTVETQWFQMNDQEREREFRVTSEQLYHSLTDAPPQHCSACHY